MTMMIQRVNANSPAQAVKSRARGPTITQLRAKQAALVAAAELAASSNAEASVVRHSPVDEAKRWASGKGRKVGFAKARATFRGGGTGIAATAAKHDSLIKKARWRGTEQIARETPAGSVSVVTMPHRKDFASDKEHQVKFNLWLKADTWSTWSTWSAVINLTSRAGELRSAPSEPDDRYRATGKRALAPRRVLPAFVFEGAQAAVGEQRRTGSGQRPRASSSCNGLGHRGRRGLCATPGGHPARGSPSRSG